MFAKLGYYICVPFAFLTRLFYSWTGSYGVALILFTLVVKLVLLPFQLKSKKSMLRMNRMQGKIKDIQTRYANNQQRQQEAMQELYMKEGINPMSGCLWSMIPFPILIALYYIIRVPLRYFMSLSESVIAEITTLAGTLGFTAAEGSQAYEQIYLAKFIHEHWTDFAGKFDGLIDLNYNFLHIDLAAQPSSLFSQFPGGGWPVWGALLLPIISAGIQFAMSLITMRTNGSTPNGSAKTMMYMMPLMYLWFGYSMPAGMCIYMAANALCTVGQEAIFNKILRKDIDKMKAEAAEREEKEKAELAARKAEIAERRRLQEEANKANKGKKKAKKPASAKKPANKNGRIGIRTYALGRDYDPDRYGGVTAYRDPQEIIDEQAVEDAYKKKRRRKADAVEQALQQAEEAGDLKAVKKLEEKQAELAEAEAAAEETAAELTETEVGVEAAAADSAAENDGTETPAEEGSIADETFAQLNTETSAEADAEAKDQSSDDNA